MKLPVLIPYIHTPDGGMELKYTLRSLKNITNWNGEVYIAGDREPWLQNIHHVKAQRIQGNPIQDVENKIYTALKSNGFPEEFIFMNDDIFISEKTEVTPLHSGELTVKGGGYYSTAKLHSLTYLRSKGIDNPLDYALHVPMIMNKPKRLEVSEIIRKSKGTPPSARILYGNLFNIGGEYYEDKKTKTPELKEGIFISTQYYTDELNNLFAKKSRFEK